MIVINYLQWFDAAGLADASRLLFCFQSDWPTRISTCISWKILDKFWESAYKGVIKNFVCRSTNCSLCNTKLFSLVKSKHAEMPVVYCLLWLSVNVNFSCRLYLYSLRSWPWLAVVDIFWSRLIFTDCQHDFLPKNVLRRMNEDIFSSLSSVAVSDLAISGDMLNIWWCVFFNTLPLVEAVCMSSLSCSI